MLAGLALVPWHMQQDSVLSLEWLGGWANDAGAAPGLLLAARLGHLWLWPIIAVAAASATAILLPLGQRSRGATLASIGVLGLFCLAAQGFAVTGPGWSAPWLDVVFGPLTEGQFGMGAGAALTGAGFLFLATTGAALRGAFRGDRFTAGAAGLVAAVVLLFTFWPITLALLSAFDGGLGQFTARVADRRLWGWRGSAVNTLLVGVGVAACTTALGLAFALLVTRTRLPLRRTLRALTVLPIITPPFVVGLGLILILGRAGLVNQVAEALFGLDLGRWIYGFPGVLLAQVFSFTPVAFLVLIGVVEGLSPTLEEAALTLRANGARTFRSVTLPLLRPGLTNALGCVVADLRHDFVATVNQPLEALAEGRIADLFARQVESGTALLARENVAVERIVTLHRADMQFQGQSHILPVAIDSTAITLEELRAVFAAAYWKRFGVALPEIRPVLVNLHTAVIGRRKAVSLRAIASSTPKATLAEARRTTRPVWFDGGWVDTPVYVRDSLPERTRFDGPAIVEQLDCTTVIGPGQRVEVDAIGNLIVSV